MIEPDKHGSSYTLNVTCTLSSRWQCLLVKTYILWTATANTNSTFYYSNFVTEQICTYDFVKYIFN